MADIFLSYAREDVALAATIAAEFQKRGWSVWWDRNIPLGQDFSIQVQRELDCARCVVVLWSQTSVRSPFVRDEAGEGLSNGRLVPLLIERVKQPLGFRQLQAADLTEWRQGQATESFDRLLVAIETTINSTPDLGANATGGALAMASSESELSRTNFASKIGTRRTVAIVGALTAATVSAALVAWSVGGGNRQLPSSAGTQASTQVKLASATADYPRTEPDRSVEAKKSAPSETASTRGTASSPTGVSASPPNTASELPVQRASVLKVARDQIALNDFGSALESLKVGFMTSSSNPETRQLLSTLISRSTVHAGIRQSLEEAAKRTIERSDDFLGSASASLEGWSNDEGEGSSEFKAVAVRWAEVNAQEDKGKAELQKGLLEAALLTLWKAENGARILAATAADHAKKARARRGAKG